MTVEIPLTQGQVAIVDDEDGDLAQFKWHARFDPSYGNGGKFIAKRRASRLNVNSPGGKMHRVILSRKLGRPLLSSEKVDHIHGNPLDNRRSELRLATTAQNMMNRGKLGNNTSGYKGVYWNKCRQKWCAQIGVNGEKKYLGLFDTPEEAFQAYCNVGREDHGEFFNPGQ